LFRDYFLSQKIIALPFVRALSDYFMVTNMLIGSQRYIFLFLMFLISGAFLCLSIWMLSFHKVYFELSALISVLMFAFIAVEAEGPSRSAKSGKGSGEKINHVMDLKGSHNVPCRSFSACHSFLY
jgi:hypothetical protein